MGPFTVPARRLALLGLLLVVGAGVSSCRSSITSPAASLSLATVTSPVPEPPATEAAAVDVIHARVPQVTNLTTDVRDGTLFIRGTLRNRSRDYEPFYAPATDGGWALQLFVDTEPARSDYWLGFDYVVRGVEFDAARRTFVTRRITLDPNTPGGWGPESGTATFTQRSMHRFEIAVPVASIGAIDGDVAFCLETYATTVCDECAGGLTQEFADDYFGTISEARGRGPVAIAPRPFGLRTLALPRAGHTAAADRALIAISAR